MFEYTSAYLKPFSWAQKAYEHMLKLSNNPTVEITANELIAPTPLDNSRINIFTSSDWNYHTRKQVSSLGAIFTSIDQAEEYYNSLFSLVSSRLAESEKRIAEQTAALRVLTGGYQNSATMSIHLKGGDTTQIESQDKYYRNFPPLASVLDEGVFRLKDTGHFSSIRSLGGFAGKTFIEFALGTIVEDGNLKNISDGSRNTFWSGSFYAPAPMKASQQDIAWLPSDYQHGFAFLLTYYVDRPTLATEVYLEPISTEPMDLVTISWTPLDVINSLSNGTVTSSGSWSYTGNSSFVASSLGQGIASGAALTIHSSGFVSQTFPVTGTYLASASQYTTTGRRTQIHYSMKGKGKVLSGARLIWYNASGGIIDYSIKEDYPSAFYNRYRFVSFVPSGAVSGRIDFGIFSLSTAASAYFDELEILMGEKEFLVNETIDRPKTISLPEIARSGRYSFTFAQRNPRREILTKEAANQTIYTFDGNAYLDPTIQYLTRKTAHRLINTGPGMSLFVYRFGMKELDLRYREHIPRGSLTSLPLFTRREIREIWITSELGQFYNDNTKFYIYPFADDASSRTDILPYLVGDVGSSSSTLSSEGEILKIFTTEEQASGWVNPLSKHYIVEPQKTNESFDGTDREGKVKLSYAPHLRRIVLNQIQDWQDNFSIWPTRFDPNLQTITGLPSSMSSTIEAIRTNSSTGFVIDSLISREGYLPLKVTITTDKWTAYPDLYGRPDVSKVRTALAEELAITTLVETSIETKLDYQSFDSWINSTTCEKFLDSYGQNINWTSGLDGKLTATISSSSNKSKSLHEAIELAVGYTLIDTQQQFIIKKRTELTNQLKNVYNKLKADGKIPKDSSKSTTLTSAVEILNVYATKYKPIISGKKGAFLRLYWSNDALSSFSSLPQSNYELQDSGAGLIRVLGEAPSGFTKLLADYKYISYSETEDHFSSVLSFTVATSSISGASSNSSFVSKPLPMTRNMTDYENGRIPTLRVPNFDRLSKDYYPIIEYYINSDGEIIFSRDFFRYGDIPARIQVEYDTLAIQPRVAVEVTRTGSPAVTPSIYNTSMRVREGASQPLREIE